MEDVCELNSRYPAKLYPNKVKLKDCCPAVQYISIESPFTPDNANYCIQLYLECKVFALHPRCRVFSVT